MRIALYQPDQAGNVGTILRLAACLDVPVDLIEPLGFPWGDRALKRAGMDYAGRVDINRHRGWAEFRASIPGRVVLFSSKAAIRLDEAVFEREDTLLFGSESGGVPDLVRDSADLSLRIPQAAETRSLNIAVAAGIGLAEALRQVKGFPAS